MSFETTVDLVHRWLTWDMDPTTRAQIEALAASQDWSQLEKRLRTRIQFGTAGLRGPMEAGFANINCLTVIQASQGVASYLASSPHGARSVVIGYDIRHQSSKFARLAANAFKRKGIEPILFEQYVPTPLVAFGVRHYHADAGVMITASHNPPQDNGYKVYLSNSAQINAPVDQLIAASILENQEPWEGAWDTTLDKDAPASVNDTVDAYTARVKWALERLQPSIPADRITVPLPISTEKSAMYTPLHGVGNNYLQCVVTRVTRSPLEVVEPQRLPDPDFPTVRFPNPEEDGALDLAYFAADAAKQSLVIANDPDADRFAAAQKLPDGKWHRFTGDQVGVLLASYLLDRVDRDHIVSDQPTDTTPPSGNEFAIEGQSRYGADETGSSNTLVDHSRGKQRKIAMLTTAVSSGRHLRANETRYGTCMLTFTWCMLACMAHAHGVHFEETLTGFKWLGNRAHAMAADYNVIFAYEEALGYMFPSISYDKDGIVAAALFLNAVQYWKSDGHMAGHMTPYEKLDFLYQKYGYHESINTYFISPNPSYTREFFDTIRMCKETVNIEIRSFKILRWRDVTNGIEQPMAPHPNAFTTTLPMDRNSQMLTFHMQHIPEKGEAEDSTEDLVTMTVRASGTEPKVKLYIECRSESQKVAQSLAGKAFEAVVCMWMLEYGKEMKPASLKIKSSSGIMHGINADFAWGDTKG